MNCKLLFYDNIKVNLCPLINFCTLTTLMLYYYHVVHCQILHDAAAAFNLFLLLFQSIFRVFLLLFLLCPYRIRICPVSCIWGPFHLPYILLSWQSQGTVNKENLRWLILLLFFTMIILEFKYKVDFERWKKGHCLLFEIELL